MLQRRNRTGGSWKGISWHSWEGVDKGRHQRRTGGRCGGWRLSWTDSLRSKEGYQQNFHHGFPEVKLWPVWDDRVPREAVLQSKGDQKGWKSSMNKILQVQEHSHGPRDEMLGKETSLDEQGDLARAQDK